MSKTVGTYLRRKSGTHFRHICWGKFAAIYPLSGKCIGSIRNEKAGLIRQIKGQFRGAILKAPVRFDLPCRLLRLLQPHLSTRSSDAPVSVTERRQMTTTSR